MSDTSEIDEAVRERWLQKQVRDSEETAKRERDRRERERLETYTPGEFFPGRFAFLVDVKPCVHCAKPTVANLSGGPFPAYFRINFEAQRDRAGIKALAHWHDSDRPVCVGCVKTGAETFNCSHCKQKRPLNESHASFGAPAEHLCTHCWETVPAKQWHGLFEELEEQHRYDFE